MLFWDPSQIEVQDSSSGVLPELGLLQELGFTCKDSMVLRCDSMSARYITTNPVYCERTKHNEIDCHLVQEKVNNKRHQAGVYTYRRIVGRFSY